MATGAQFDAIRAERLLEAGRALVAELDTEVVLERLLETARELTGAHYAAIGVLDEERRELERFLTAGIDPQTHAPIGDLPARARRARPADRRRAAARPASPSPRTRAPTSSSRSPTVR